MADNTTNNLSLEDLDTDTSQVQNTPIEEGDGTKKPEDVKDKLEGEDQETSEENEEEEELEEEEEKESTKEEEEEENEEGDSTAFFEQLSQETGFNVDDLEVDFDGVDPLSPAGISKVIQAFKDKEVEQFDSYLKTDYPEAYNHFMALQAGMTSEEYFKSIEGGIEVVPSEQQVSDSTDLQKELIRQDLIAKGIKKESIINATLKDFEENDELLSHSLEVRKEKEDARNEKFQELEEKAAKKVQEEANINNSISNELGKILTTGVIASGVTIPKAERANVINDFKKGLRIENGKVLFVTEVDPTDVASALGKTYLSNKGSLEKVIETKAKTVNALRVRAQVQEENKSSKAKKNRKSTGLTLGEMEE